jgi:hypothetical protein
MKKIAIYTAIFGDFDELKPPAPQDVECDFFCFTDAPLPKAVGAWRTIQVRRDPAVHPRMQSKWFKTMSHEVFPRGRLGWRWAWAGRIYKRPRYDATIWCDGSMQIKGATMARDISGLLHDHSFAMFKHPDRDCIFEEAAASPAKKYGLALTEQVETYRAAGTPPHGGLYAGGFIGRKLPASLKLIEFERAWWAENLKWGPQDQLSFPHLVRQRDVPVATIPAHLRNNPYFDLVPHKSDA